MLIIGRVINTIGFGVVGDPALCGNFLALLRAPNVAMPASVLSWWPLFKFSLGLLPQSHNSHSEAQLKHQSNSGQLSNATHTTLGISRSLTIYSCCSASTAKIQQTSIPTKATISYDATYPHRLRPLFNQALVVTFYKHYCILLNILLTPRLFRADTQNAFSLFLRLHCTGVHWLTTAETAA